MSKQAYSKSKGRAWENQVVGFLRECGIEAERRRLTGAQDCGDIGGWPGVVVSCKAEKSLNLAGYMDELGDQVLNAALRYKGTVPLGVAFVKRRGSGGAENGYAVMSPHVAVLLLKSYLRGIPSDHGDP